MKTTLIILILLFVTSQLPAQNGKIVKGKRYEGAVFDSSYQMLYRTNQSSEFRFTPTPEEVAKLEGQLKKEIKSMNANKANQGQHDGLVIHKNLNKYVRQYIGFITPEEERVIYVNFLWNKLNLIE